jgi:hypothetical protein
MSAEENPAANAEAEFKPFLTVFSFFYSTILGLLPESRYEVRPTQGHKGCRRGRLRR